MLKSVNILPSSAITCALLFGLLDGLLVSFSHVSVRRNAFILKGANRKFGYDERFLTTEASTSR